MLKKLDRVIRSSVKAALHIPPGTPDAYFYLKSSNGGLGLKQLRVAIPNMRLKARSRMRFCKPFSENRYQKSKSCENS